MSSEKNNWPWLQELTLNQANAYVKQWPKISIITPSYNQGRYLEETIRSIVLQNYPNYEIIIIDASSTDNTREIIQKYEPWITYWVSEPDRGQSHAIQKGLALSTGEIINWINSDDLVAPGAFHSIAAEFDLVKYDVICGYCDYFLNDLNHLDLRNERMGLSGTVGSTLIEKKINQPSTFFKASIIKDLGIDEQFRFTMDLDLWFRYLLRAGQSKVLLSDSLFTYFRLHESSKSVAESTLFEGDIWKVYYNILYTLNQNACILEFASQAIPNFSGFKPMRYPINVSLAELTPFVRYMAWSAVHYYNEIGNYDAARTSLVIARRNGQPINGAMLRQLIKLYALPSSFVRWLVAHTSRQVS